MMFWVRNFEFDVVDELSSAQLIGHVCVVEMEIELVVHLFCNWMLQSLLQEDAQINAADSTGYQTTHFAAQFGQTAFLYYVVSKMLTPMFLTMMGEAPCIDVLAAYKDFTDCIRLLLFLDAHRGRQDKEGCTPLHRAANRGNLEACTVLVQAGKKEDLMVTDNTGFTPAQLASDKNHR
ncbi:hypothetical protein RJT34_32429 [Clitoria ternatea]|uniref:Uncharacterized protein n=1 Tax=Clitoria ternatea TaxID=43366 RepID=A0AAN9I2A5_CLITE